VDDGKRHGYSDFYNRSRRTILKGIINQEGTPNGREAIFGRDCR